MTNTVTATFKNYAAAREAIVALESAGIQEEQLSAVTADKTFGNSFNMDENTKAPEGAAAGAAIGGLTGALIAGLTSIGTVTTAGLGVFAAGPMVAALAGAGAAGATGGLIGALIGYGIPEHEARLYEDEIKNGSVLLAVQAESDEQAERVENILKREDAHNIAA